MAATFPDVDKELCQRISPLQPELAPRLAERMAQLPVSRLDAILTSEIAFMEALDWALAQELTDQTALTEKEVAKASAPTFPALAPTLSARFAQQPVSVQPLPTRRTVSPVYYCRQVTSEAATFRAASPNQDSAALLLMARVARVQPEKAARIVERIFQLGPKAVHECIFSELALQHCMEAALAAMAQEELELPSVAAPKVSVRCASPATVYRDDGTRQATAPVRTYARLLESSPLGAEQPCTARIRATTPDARVRVASPTILRPLGVRQLSRVWGLEDFLAELSLTERTAEATAWAGSMGAAYLEELLENVEDFADALNLRPLERVRLQRYGSEIVARLTARRPTAVLLQAANTTAAPQA